MTDNSFEPNSSAAIAFSKTPEARCKPDAARIRRPFCTTIVGIEPADSGAYAIAMSAIPQTRHISVDEYLDGEVNSPNKHEYLGGYIYAMAGATIAHDRIAGNVFASLHSKLRGKPCQPYTSDMKVRVTLPMHVRFYYPDTMVVCDSNPPQDSFQDCPVVIVEVLSRRTRRTDEGEKRDAYLTIPMLCAYLLVEQDFPTVDVLRRSDQGFVHETHTDLGAIIALPEIGVELSLAEIYERVEFVPEPEDEES